MANFTTGLLRGFTVGANPATTSISNSLRAKTQIASLIIAAFQLVTLVTLFDFVAFLP